MKVTKNPFCIGVPVREPGGFGGRREILELLSYHMLNLQNVSLRGERRTGKTSLLLYLRDTASLETLGLPKNHITVYFDFQEVAEADEAQVWQAMANAVAERIKQTGDEGEAESERFLNTTGKYFAFKSYVSGLDAAFAGLAKYNIHLLFDEFEQTADNPNLGNSFYKALRSLPTVRAKNISYVIGTRTELAALQPGYNKYSSPFFNIFTCIILPPFQNKEVRKLIFVYFKHAGLNMQLAEKLCAKLPLLYDITGYHPFFLQTFCYHLCTELDSSDWPSGEAWRKALKAFNQDACEHFQYYWEISSPKEQNFIKRLAANKHIQQDTAGVKPVINKLKERCLLVPVDETENSWKLFSNVFGEWVNERLSFSGNTN